MELYRYRSFKYGLLEITNQTIFFAARNELNDPVVEGFLNVYWDGDKIAWDGLFRNYICSLYRALLQYFLQADEDEIKFNAAMNDVHLFDDVPLGKVFQELGNSFLQHEEVLLFSNMFENNRIRISRDDLVFCLLSVQHLALIDAFEALDNHGHKSEEIKKLCKKIKEQFTSKPILDKIFCVENLEARQKALHESVNRYNDAYQQIYVSVEDHRKKAWFTIMTNFPNLYVDKLEDFIHPDVFMACFSKNDNDNSMWGKYAENHSGLCMIYETHLVKGTDTIAMFLPYGYSNEGQLVQYQDEKLYPINYGSTVREANFFTMLGRLSGKQLYSWLSDENGNRSRCLNQIYNDEEHWRKEYWQCLYDRYCHKTRDWEHENEYRMLLVNMFDEFNTPESRTIKYHFSNLKGVVLGMNMSPENRAKVLEAIQNKCSEIGRSDFEVYVAEYDYNTDSITKRRIGISRKS